MNVIIFRTILIYILIVVAMRLMGKRQLGELQPAEFVTTILISNLASISIEQPELPLISSIVPVFIIVCLEILISAACVYNKKIANLIAGAPRVVIKNGKIDQKMLKELRYTTDDLLESLRAKDVFDVTTVDFAIVETNGSMSVFKKFASDTPTNKDLKIDAPKHHGPVLPIILDGEVDEANLAYYNKTKSWLEDVCDKENCKIKNVMLCLHDAENKITLIKKENS